MFDVAGPPARVTDVQDFNETKSATGPICAVPPKEKLNPLLEIEKLSIKMAYVRPA